MPRYAAPWNRLITALWVFLAFVIACPAGRGWSADDRDAEISREIWSLAENWEANRSRVLANLDSPDPVRRRVAANAIPLEVSPGDAARVVPLILDPDISVSTAAITRFLDWRLDSAVPVLGQVLELDNPKLKKTAAMALALQCNESGFRLLDAFVRDSPDREILDALDRGLSDVTCADPNIEKRKTALAGKVADMLAAGPP